MSRVVVACLARNEANRFWRSALEAWKTFADEILVVDDGSDDDTAEIALEHGAFVDYGRGPRAWGHESKQRRLLFERACEIAGVGSWVFVLDADMTPACDPRPLLADDADYAAFVLYDLWREDEDGSLWYRDDTLWQAHYHPRVWAVRVKEPPDGGWRWYERGIHCGHLPKNLDLTMLAPRIGSLLHYGYLTPQIRREKWARYASVSEQLTTPELRHAQTILDAKPNLVRLPFEPELRLKLETTNAA